MPKHGLPFLKKLLVFHPQLEPAIPSLARCLVPKMVKNGIYSLFGVWVWENPASCGICRSSTLFAYQTSPYLDANRQKKNKNHFTPISGQASALSRSGI
jgi:hypothetical protein